MLPFRLLLFASSHSLTLCPNAGLSLTNVQLNIDKTGQAYTYDSEGNLISAKDNAGRSETYNYSNARELTKLKTTDNKEYEFTYSPNNDHQLQSATSKSSNIKYIYYYDGSGNVTSVTSESTNADYTKFIKQYTKYTPSENYLARQAEFQHPDVKVETLLDTVDELLSEDRDQKIIIFTEFVATQRYLQRLLTAKGW